MNLKWKAVSLPEGRWALPPLADCVCRPPGPQVLPVLTGRGGGSRGRWAWWGGPSWSHLSPRLTPPHHFLPWPGFDTGVLNESMNCQGDSSAFCPQMSVTDQPQL